MGPRAHLSPEVTYWVNLALGPERAAGRWSWLGSGCLTEHDSAALLSVWTPTLLRDVELKASG